MKTVCPISPAVEAADLKSVQGQFESDIGYQNIRNLIRIITSFEIR